MALALLLGGCGAGVQAAPDQDPDLRPAATTPYLQQLEPPPAPAPPDLDALDAALLAEAGARAAEGAALFAQYCVACHGEHGEGHVGPPLGDAAWLHGGRPAEVLRSIALGHPQKGMPGWAPVVGEDAVRSLAVHVVRGLAAPGAPAAPAPLH